MSSGSRVALLRQLPSVDELLNRPRLTALTREAGHGLVVEAARGVLDELRADIAQRGEAAAIDAATLEARIAGEIARLLQPSLRPVINATGVILHTNLGRAPLAPAAVEHLRATVTQYSNLEYDVAAGQRGKRDAHTARLLARVLGAEAAIVVNNNAAAVCLVLNTLAIGGEVIVSRGELIEIGDGFRIPDIMSESGAALREVGTTNRTALADYERAIGERSRLLLRVHPSNFRIVGFTNRVGLEELVELGRRSRLPVFEDLGSGCLADLSPYGFDEPLASASLRAGASLVSFSGDKLLGGPQAGIIAGKRELVERCRRNPMFRALRVDKLTIAVLEATLLACLRGAFDEIPALRMIRLSADEVGRRAEALVAKLRSALPAGEVELEIIDGQSVIGGGSTPEQSLPTRLIAISSLHYSAAQLEERLRTLPLASQSAPDRGASTEPPTSPPVIARIEEGRLLLDLRTVLPEQESQIAAALVSALR
ncbi:MAG: L-seryl-tRNA(Sec) selenium transferase [Candidatus Acidiferrales bacterium]